MCVLFFLPGSALPKESWLDAIHFDKIVHIGLFAVLIFLCRTSGILNVKNYVLVLLLLAFMYGLSVEFIQKEWVSNRSFDLTDLAADMAGSVIGLGAWTGIYRKK
jgi:VanZ family protein